MCSILPPPRETPTLSEISELASLVPAVNPPPPSLPGLVEPLAQVLSRKWCRDFIFTPSALHVQHMISPLMPMNSLTCELTCTSIDPYAPPMNPSGLPGEGYHASGYALFVPAFTADHVTVGVGAQHGTFSNIIPALATVARSGTADLNLRFALDATRRILLLVVDCAEDNMLYVLMARVESSTSSRVFSGFVTKELQDVALALDGDSALSARDILPSLVVAQDELHTYACTLCAAPPEASCGCSIVLSDPRHPFDHSYFMREISYHLSSSCGLASKLTVNDEGKRHILVGSRMIMKGIVNAQVTQRLSTWSVMKYASGLKQDPLQSILPGSNSESADLCNHARAQRTGGPRTVGVLHAAMQGEIQKLMESTAESSFIPTGSPTMPQTPHALLADTILHPTGSNIPAVSLNAPMPVLQLEGSAGEDVLQNGPAGNYGALQSLDEDEITPVLQMVPYEETQGSNHHPRQVIKELKEQEKRARNRESARRSNLRQKNLRDELKAEIKANMHQVEVLRIREMELRSENINLRKEVEKRKGG